LILCSTAFADDVLLCQFSSAFPMNDAGDLPGEIQWAPPGKHTISATQNGKPVTKEVLVNAAGAERVQAFLSKALEDARAGAGDLPYFDLNHDDREASGWPTEFFWGGSDPKSGGIRAKLEWSKAGRDAVANKTYRRFSPAMRLSDSGEIIGSDTNMGGLVNRAAFKAIQPILAKESAPQNETAAQGPFFVTLAKQVAIERGTSEAEACRYISAKCPALYEMYRAGILGKRFPERHFEQASATPHALITTAKALAKNRGIGLTDATLIQAKHNPELYEDYRQSLVTYGRNSSDRREHPFVAEAIVLAKARGMKLGVALATVAEESPGLYRKYCTDLWNAAITN
jgi:hypothetical protein